MRIASALSIALPLLPSAYAGSYFNLLALTMHGNSINQRPVNANGGNFWVGKPTKSYCPPTEPQCPAFGNETVLYIPFSTMGMDVKVSGGQQAYIAANGALKFTKPALPAIPPGATKGPFVEVHTSGDDVLTWGADKNQTFLACPTNGQKGPFRIVVPLAGVKRPSAFCKEIYLVVKYWFKGGYAAYQYV